MLSDDPIDLTVDPQDLLPRAIVDQWLPGEDKSILYLFQQFDQYPPHPSHYILPSDIWSVLHQGTIDNFEYRSLLEVAPPALSSISKAYQDAIKKSKHPILSVTLQPHHGNPIRLPAWVFEYWVEIRRVVDTRRQWKAALTWVQKYSALPSARDLCYSLLLGLSSFSWSRGAAYSHDITALLSDTPIECYLSSFHIDHMVGQMETQHGAQLGPHHPNNHIFATVDLLRAIVNFYGAVYAKKEGHLWDSLMKIENKIIMGEVDSLGGIMHLPLHWVSVVVNFQQLQILYGDSLGQQMPKHERKAFERWIGHLVNRSSKIPTHGKITLGQLPTGYQDDSSSCGLFALNAIGHHYLGYPLLSSDLVGLACYRIEIALDIINTMTVCIFHMIEMVKLIIFYRL
jgi:hypothetical protein